MSKEIRYQEKYANLKSKFMESVDLAFRLGFEQGQQQAQKDQMAQQQQQQEMQAAQQAQMQGQPGQPGADGQDPSQGAAPGGAPGADAGAQAQPNPMGSELDQHLNELESLLGKSEMSVNDLKSLQKSIGAIKMARDLKKSSEAIKGIGLALHKPAFKINQQAQHNLTETAKQSLHIQKKIVDDVFKSWDAEEARATSEIGDALRVEGLINK